MKPMIQSMLVAFAMGNLIEAEEQLKTVLEQKMRGLESDITEGLDELTAKIEKLNTRNNPWQLYEKGDYKSANKELTQALLRAIKTKTVKEAWAVLDPVFKKHRDIGAMDSEAVGLADMYLERAFDSFFKEELELQEEATVKSIKLAIPLGAKALRKLSDAEIEQAVDDEKTGFIENQEILTLTPGNKCKNKVVYIDPYWDEDKKLSAVTPSLMKRFKDAFDDWCYSYGK